MIRVVSLLPSTTEIVCALGMRSVLLGRSHECDYPAEVGGLPVLTAARFDTARPSREIDDAVKSLLRRALSIYDVRADTLRDLKPEVILTQSQCEVCAVSEQDVERAAGEWCGLRPRILSLEPTGLESVWDSIGLVAEAIGAPERGEALLARIRERVAAIAARAARGGESPGVACIEWIDPLMSAGNWVPEMVALAGGVNLCGEAGVHSPRLGWDELAAADPGLIVVMPCGFGLERTGKEMEVLRGNPAWEGLRAVREGRVFLTDGNAYFNRPGPRLVDSLEILAEIFHPERIPPAQSGRGWTLWHPGGG